MMRTGYPLIGRLYMGLIKPKNKISGTCFSGTVEAIGQHVVQFNPGENVFGESLDTFGTYAEYICIKEDGIISKLPENINHEEAAIVGDGLITSLNFLRNLGKIKAHHNVLIIGASGSLGTAAVQLAKNFGAKVTGVCSTKNIEMVRSLGADKVIDYKNENFLTNGKTYDIIYDTIGGSSFRNCKNSLTKNGIYMSPFLILGCFSKCFLLLFLEQKKPNSL